MCLICFFNDHMEYPYYFYLYLYRHCYMDISYVFFLYNVYVKSVMLLFKKPFFKCSKNRFHLLDTQLFSSGHKTFNIIYQNKINTGFKKSV